MSPNLTEREQAKACSPSRLLVHAPSGRLMSVSGMHRQSEPYLLDTVKLQAVSQLSCGPAPRASCHHSHAGCQRMARHGPPAREAAGAGAAWQTSVLASEPTVALRLTAPHLRALLQRRPEAEAAVHAGEGPGAA